MSRDGVRQNDSLCFGVYVAINVRVQVASIETEDEEDAQYAMVGEETEIEIAEEPIKVGWGWLKSSYMSMLMSFGM